MLPAFLGVVLLLSQAAKILQCEDSTVAEWMQTKTGTTLSAYDPICLIKMKIFEFISEVVGWILITLSPTGIGGFIGYLCLVNLVEPWGIISLIGLTGLGFVIGAMIATRQWRSKGTVHFLTRVSASPELDDPE